LYILVPVLRPADLPDTSTATEPGFLKTHHLEHPLMLKVDRKYQKTKRKGWYSGWSIRMAPQPSV